MCDNGYTTRFGYINDLPNCLEHTKVNMFADDTQIETAGYDVNTIAEELNQDLKTFQFGCRQIN